MSKKAVLVPFILLMVLVFSSIVATAQVPLIADGGSDLTAVTVGSATVVNTGFDLIITMNTDSPWVLGDTKIAVGSSLDEIPQTKNGNPKTGHFPYVSGDVIPLPDTSVGEHTVYIATHANVVNPDEIVGYEPDPQDPDILVPIYREETAWGEGEDFSGKNWAMYFEYTYEIIE